MNWTPPMVLTLEKKCSSCISLMFLQCCQSDTSSVPMASWDSNNADGLLFDHCIMIPWHSESYSFDVPHFTKCITKKYIYQTQRESLNLSHRRFLRHSHDGATLQKFLGESEWWKVKRSHITYLSQKLCFYTERNWLWPQFRQTQRPLVQYAE